MHTACRDSPLYQPVAGRGFCYTGPVEHGREMDACDRAALVVMQRFVATTRSPEEHP